MEKSYYQKEGKYVLFSYYANDDDVYRSYKILDRKEYSIKRLVDRDCLIETIAISDDFPMLKKAFNELNMLLNELNELRNITSSFDDPQLPQDTFDGDLPF